MLDNAALRNLTLDEALEDFHLSCRAKAITTATFDLYKSSANMFVAYLKEKTVERPADVTSERVNQLLDQVRQRRRAEGQRPLANATVHAIARGTKALLRFSHSGGICHPRSPLYPASRSEISAISCPGPRAHNLGPTPLHTGSGSSPGAGFRRGKAEGDGTL